MVTVRFIRFSKLNYLKQIDPVLFLELINNFAAFFDRQGVALPEVPDPERIPYQEIANSFMRLDAERDKDLIETLYYLDSLSGEAEADILIDKAEEAGITLIEGRPNAVDLVVRVRLHPGGPELLQQVQDRLEISRFRTFRLYQSGKKGHHEYHVPPVDRISVAIDAIRSVFEKRKRGRECSISWFEEADEVWFLVRHGEIMSRAESISDDGRSGVLMFRPVKYDVVIYNRERHELRTNVKSKWLLELYRRQFGKIIFDDEEFFAGEAKYTFAPLRYSGIDALACPEIDEIEEIVLREIKVVLGTGDDAEYITHRAANLFERWARHKHGVPGGTIICAEFAVRFANSRTPRTVTLGGTNRLIVSRDSDSDPVERWLSIRGFVLGSSDEKEVV